MGVFNFKSETQLQIDQINLIIALAGLTDISPGSVLDVLTQASAQEDFAQYVQMARLLRLQNLDNLTNTDLDNYAFGFGITRNAALKSAGLVTIQRDSTFVKVSTKIYSGTNAPIIGNTTLNVNDASSALISTSGTLIIGRGTVNEEEVSYSLAPVNNINYYTFTLDAPLTKNHSFNETVILKQGIDESISAGTVVRVGASSTSAEIKFTVDDDQIIYAGDDELTGVNVTAVEAGSAGNIATESISGESGFLVSPFTGARVVNESKFTTGRDRESDDSLRDRIKNHIQSLSRGTKTAIKNAIVGLVDPNTAKRVISANIILPTVTSDNTKVYIDDGTGFEPSFEAKGFETIITQATGGESRLPLSKNPLVKAQAESVNEELFNMTGALTLIYEVGSVSETITFAASDFEFPESATAEEITRAINNNASLIEARTSQSGKKIVITSILDTNESLQITGGTANTVLGFPTEKIDTLYLYVNDQLQNKDGETALIDSQNTAPYDLAAIGAFPQTLTVVVDDKSANEQTVTFQAANFVNTASATVDEIIAVINAQLAGAVALNINNDTQVRIKSNTLLSADSKIEITGGTINNAGDGLNFDTTEVAGKDKDYILNRQIGMLELNTALSENDQVTIGSIYTRAYLRASLSENYTPLNTETLDIDVDGGATQTIVFDATFALGKTAEDTATFINAQLIGATAIVREIGGANYLEIRSNSYDESVGSISVLSSSTGNATMGFEEDVIVYNQRPHTAFASSVAGPFSFRQNDNLVVVLDDDIVNSTYNILLNYNSEVSTLVDTTHFRAVDLINIFETTDILIDYYAAFLTGSNTLTVSGDVVEVTRPGGAVSRYVFGGLPAGLNNYAAGDIVSFSDMQNDENNGDFIITAVSVAGNGYIQVNNTNGLVESGSVGTGIAGQSRIITAYDETNGLLTVGAAYTNAPAVLDTLILIPSTIQNLLDYLNNIKITSLSTTAVIESSNNATKLQLSSLELGSDGAIQVTGGNANALLGFSTSLVKGLQGYYYYTGLISLVHKVIYGDDTDLVSYPGVGGAGNEYDILAPTVEEISISLDVTPEEGVSLTQLENEIKSQITGYINNLGIGEDVIIERIRSVVINIKGVKDVVLIAPVANRTISENELARTRSSLITIG